MLPYSRVWRLLWARYHRASFRMLLHVNFSTAHCGIAPHRSCGTIHVVGIGRGGICLVLAIHRSRLVAHSPSYALRSTPFVCLFIVVRWCTVGSVSADSAPTLQHTMTGGAVC